VTILDALGDPSLFGGLPAFRDLSSWSSWLVFLRAIYGVPLERDDLAKFQKHTGRTTPRPGGYPEAVCITGRQSGKSAIAATVAAYEAATGTEGGTFALLVAQDQRGAQRTLFRYAVEPFQSVPAFAREVSKGTADVLELSSGVTLACYPCRPAAVRGIRACIVVCDELAYYISSEGRPTDKEMLRSLRPTTATTGGKLLILSSPYGQSGALWDLHRQHYGREDSSTLVWVGSAPSMNPTLSADYLQRMEQDDPEAYRSEVLGEFRAGISSLFDPEALDAVVISGRRELPPSSEMHYRAFADPSGGRSDSFTLAIGHAIPGARVVVDLVRAWKAPFSPAGVVEEAAALLKAYRLAEVTGDRYGGEWPAERFRAHGITYTPADKAKGDLYLELLAVVNSGRVELLDVPEMLAQLRGLERRRGPSGRDRVDHRPGSHDDSANAVAGVVSLLAGRDPSDLGLTVGSFGVPANLCDVCQGAGKLGLGSENAPFEVCFRCHGTGRSAVTSALTL
jgi:hypothetical protein